MSSQDAAPTLPAGRTPQRKDVVKQFTKDVKTKTCKCKVCGQRVTQYSQQCQACKIRLCSECLEPEGASVQGHKDIAADYFENGCWCGFRAGFNPTFAGKIPVVAKQPTIKKEKKVSGSAPDAQKTPASKRKRDQDEIEAAESAKKPKIIPETPQDHPAPELPPVTTTSFANPGDKAASKRKRAPSDEDAGRPAKRVSSGSDDTSGAGDTSADSSPSSDKSQSSGDPSKRRGRSAGQPASQKPSKSDDIVIIGAGIIGLFIALELAEKSRAAEKNRKITVVEVNAGICRLASGNCAGVVGQRGLKNNALPLADLAYGRWAKLINDNPGFRETVHFENSILTPDQTEPEAEKHLLSWAKSKDLVNDEESFGCLDPVHLANWVHQRCVDLGVDFKFETLPTKLQKDRAGDITGVKLRGVDAADSSAKVVPCSNLILAAGPFTPAIFQHLCEKPKNAPPFPLPPTIVQEAHWVDVGTVKVPRDDRRYTGVVVSDKPKASEPTRVISMVPRKIADGDDVLRVAMCQKSTRSWVNTIQALEDAQPRITEEVAASFGQMIEKHISRSATAKKEFVGHGAAYVSIPGPEGKAVMEISNGMWLSFGFGAHGTTLAPGVGHHMAQMVDGEQTGLEW